MEWCWRDVSYNYSRKLSFYASQEQVISGSLVRLPNVVQRKKTDVFGDRRGHPNDPLRSNGQAICPTRELAMQAVRFCELARWWPTLQNNSEYFFQEMQVASALASFWSHKELVVAEDGKHLETMATLKAYRTLKLISYCAKTLGLGMSVLGKFPPLPWDSQAFLSHKCSHSGCMVKVSTESLKGLHTIETSWNILKLLLDSC